MGHERIQRSAETDIALVLAAKLTKSLALAYFASAASSYTTGAIPKSMAALAGAG